MGLNWVHGRCPSWSITLSNEIDAICYGNKGKYLGQRVYTANNAQTIDKAAFVSYCLLAPHLASTNLHWKKDSSHHSTPWINTKQIHPLYFQPLVLVTYIARTDGNKAALGEEIQPSLHCWKENDTDIEGQSRRYLRRANIFLRSSRQWVIYFMLREAEHAWLYEQTFHRVVLHQPLGM
jgi:hypothetical protein